MTVANKMVNVFGPNESEIMSEDDFRKRILESNKLGVQELLDRSSPNNVDFSTLDTPALKSKVMTIHKTKFNVNLHTDPALLYTLSKYYNQEFQAFFQLFHKKESVLLFMTREMINDSGHAWDDQEVIDRNDIINRAIAALRIHCNNPVLQCIAMELAYGNFKYPGVDAGKLHYVWD